MRNTPSHSRINLRPPPLRAAWIGAFVFLLAGAQAWGDGMSASVDKKVIQPGETLTLTVRMDSSAREGVEDLVLPDLADFHVLNHSPSTSQSIVFDGRGPTFTSIVVHTFVLRPRREGTLTIGQGSMRSGDQIHRTAALNIRVGDGPVPSEPQPAPPAEPVMPAEPLEPAEEPADEVFSEAPLSKSSALTPAEARDGTLFLRAVADRAEAWEGQQVGVTIYLYTRSGVQDVSIMEEPTMDGFWAEDLLGPTPKLDFEYVILDGQRWAVGAIRKQALFPMRSGELQVGPLVAELFISRGFFSQHRVVRSTRPISITVKPLPTAGRPKDFNKAMVGRFQLQAQVDNTKIKAGEAVSYQLTLRGNGNIKGLASPTLPTLPDCRAYPPTVEDLTSTVGGELRGEKKFSYLIVPAKAGPLLLPSLTLPYFDPQVGRYKELRARTFRVAVEGGPAEAKALEPSKGQGESAETRMMPLRETSRLQARQAPLYRRVGWQGRNMFMALLIGPLLLVLSLSLLEWLRSASRVNPQRKVRRATSFAYKGLREAEKLIKEGDGKAFFGEISQVLVGYLEEKHQTALAGMTMDQLRSYLIDHGYSETMAEALVQELEGCDFARFASGSINDKEMQRALRGARELLLGLESGGRSEEAPRA